MPNFQHKVAEQAFYTHHFDERRSAGGCNLTALGRRPLSQVHRWLTQDLIDRGKDLVGFLQCMIEFITKQSNRWSSRTTPQCRLRWPAQSFSRK